VAQHREEVHAVAREVLLHLLDRHVGVDAVPVADELREVELIERCAGRVHGDGSPALRNGAQTSARRDTGKGFAITGTLHAAISASSARPPGWPVRNTRRRASPGCVAPSWR